MIHKTMRSILSVLLAALLLVTSIPLTPAFADGGAVPLPSESGEGRALDGDGTKDNPYQIATAEELWDFAKLVNGGKTDAWAVLTADIDLNPNMEISEDGTVTNGDKLAQWTPIGNEAHRYTGTFDGNGHTISGLYINSSDKYQGLFGYVSGTGGDNTGTVQNLTVSGSVKGDNYVGGIAGQNNGSVENCHNIGSVSGDRYVGGVVGDNRGTVENCHNIGEVSGERVGGVVGDNYGGRVENCYNTGKVSGPDSGNSGNSYVGGVVGRNFGGTVENCYNTGTVSSNSSTSDVGGVVGWNGGNVMGFNRGTVENCYNTGTVTGSGSPVGGVVGYNYSGGSVTNSYNIGKVSGSGNSVGGVVGLNDGTNASVANCYFLQQNPVIPGIGNGSGGATSVTTLDELCENFENDPGWTISDTLKRPVLKDNHEDDGSEQHPYEIFTATQLENFRDLVNRGGAGANAHAKLMNNIDLSSVCGADKGSWNPIGNRIDNPYEGTFNGDGHTISGLYIDDSTADDQGLFGYVSGTVKDLTVSGSVKGNSNVGGVVGYNNGGTVTGCTFSGSGSGTGVTGSEDVGGVVGRNDGTVENCYNTGAVSGSGWYVGGIVGQNRGTVENCYNTDSVTVTGSDGRVGGVVGQNYNGTVENCYNTGSVSGSDYVGGVVGYNVDFDGYSASVENCYNTGSVTVTGSDGRVGGVVGQNFNGSITNCYYQIDKGAIVGIGDTTKDNISQTAAKSLEDFHSGEVAHLLGEAWGQSALGTDNSWPTLVALDKNAETVYQVTVDYNYVGAQNKTTYTNNPAEPAAPARDGYTFGGWDKTGEGTTTITYTAKWTAEEPPYTGKYSYEVFTSVGDNGAISVDRYATEGDKVTIDVTPDQAYKLDELVVTANGKDVELTANSDGTYTFTMPSADVRITATFAEDPDWTEPEEPATDVSDIFLDIAPDAWYKDAVQYAYDNGLMTGVSATEFAPEATTTRAMIVSILARLENVTSAQAAGFADVDDNDWYATAVNWAANVGVVNGYEDNTFRPNTAITREQLAAILMNYAAYKGEDVSNRADLTSYTDQPSTWAEEAMSWSVAEELLTGVTADTLQPQGAATRAQVAAILQRFLSE